MTAKALGLIPQSGKMAGSRRCGEMADATDLKSVGLTARAGSSPAIGSSKDVEPLNRQIITSKANFGKLSKLNGVVG